MLLGSPLAGQDRLRPGVAVQFVSQDGPLGGQSGFGAVLSVAFTPTRWLGSTLAFDAAKLQSGDGVALCVPASGGCLGRPGEQTIAGVGVWLEVQPPTGRLIQPFVGVGPALRFVGASALVGGRRHWFTPHVEGGMRLALGGAQWSLALRWRRVAQWEPVAPFPEFGVLLGVRRGRHF